MVVAITAGQAQPRQRYDRARLSSYSNGSLSSLEYSALTLDGGSQLKIISPERWAHVSSFISSALKETYNQYASSFGDIPPFASAVRLMDEDTFFLITRAPRWTNAMFFKGEIYIPLSFSSGVDYDNIRRSVKHEFTHAIIHALSDGRCPGWLDEGLAQMAEGDENPALRPAIVNWLSDNPPVALSLLQGGFTKLDSEMVAPAYAESLFAANTIVNTFGYQALRAYFDNLRNEDDSEGAFHTAFGLSSKNFEARMGQALQQWKQQ